MSTCDEEVISFHIHGLQEQPHLLSLRSLKQQFQTTLGRNTWRRNYSWRQGSSEYQWGRETGIFWRSRKGARTGSGASRSSKRTNMMNSTPETMRGAYTDESPHWKAKPCFSARNAMQETDSLHVDHCICYSERPGMRAPVELSIKRSTSVIHNLHTEPRRVKLPP